MMNKKNEKKFVKLFIIERSEMEIDVLLKF